MKQLKYKRYANAETSKRFSDRWNVVKIHTFVYPVVPWLTLTLRSNRKLAKNGRCGNVSESKKANRQGRRLNLESWRIDRSFRFERNIDPFSLTNVGSIEPSGILRYLWFAQVSFEMWNRFSRLGIIDSSIQERQRLAPSRVDLPLTDRCYPRGHFQIFSHSSIGRICEIYVRDDNEKKLHLVVNVKTVKY